MVIRFLMEYMIFSCTDREKVFLDWRHLTIIMETIRKKQRKERFSGCTTQVEQQDVSLQKMKIIGI